MVRAGHALGIALMCVAIAQYGALAPAPPSTGIAFVAPGVLMHPARKAPAKGDAHGCRRLVARPLRPHRVRRHMLEDASTAQEKKDTEGTGTSNDGTRMQTLGGRQRTFRPDGTQAEDAQGGPLEEAQKVVCAAIKSVRLALGLPVDAWDRQERMPEVEQFYAEVEREVGLWVKEVQGVEDERIASIRDALEAVSDQLNRGSSLQWSRQSKAADRVVTWRAIRKQTDPSTKNLLISIERIRRKYDKGMYRLTDKVRPWTEEEIVAGVQTVTDSLTGKQNSLSAMERDFEETTESIAGVISPYLPGEVNMELERLNAQIDSQWRSGVQAAEEELRAGVERARYNIQRRTKRRVVEDGAATLTWRDGAIYATSVDGAVSVPILDSMGPAMYIDDIDDVHIFMGMQQGQDLAQHVVALGSLPVSARRWLACARQKLWWMSPDVGDRSTPIPAETQFLLYDAGGGMYAVILPLVGNTFRSALWGAAGREGGIDLHIESGDPNVKTDTCATSVVVAAGMDPFMLLERAFAAAADRLGSFRVRKEKALPASLDVFGWCTWDAFYSQVEPDGIRAGLDSLIQGGTPSRMLILDDGWQSTENLAKYCLSAAEESDVRGDVSAADLAGGGVIEAEDFANSQLTSIKDVPVKLLTWWYLNVVEKSAYDSVPVKVWRWLTYNVIRNDIMKYFAEATDWSKRLTELTPNGKFLQLASLIRELKRDYGLQYTYCWHALTGYWLGVDPTAPGMKKFNPVIQFASNHFGYTPGILLVEPTMAWNPSSFEGVGIIPPESIRDFFGELHSNLKDAGVDGVKCDAQAAITQMGVGYGGGARMTRAYVHALEESVKEFLDGNCINCMCHPTENIYSYRDTSVARASDDFYPREPASHTVHVVNVAYNSLFLGEVTQPDWDMFQSDHVAASLHAAARAVGGCAVYTSDRPQVHDFDLLRKLVLPDGSVLRARLPGRPTRDSLFADVARDGTSALKIWNLNRVGGIVGVFNLQGAWWDRNVRNFQTLDGPVPSVTACIRPRDVEGLVSEVDRYAVWSHEQQALRILDRDQVWALDLAPKESDVLTVAALTRLPEVVDSEGREAVWAPVGLSAMLNAGGAILSVRTVRGGVRQINQLLKKIAPNMPSGGGGAGMVTSLGLELLEELRALLIMLADAEEAGGGDVSKYMAGELRDFDFGALQKLVDNMLKMPALSRETESTLQEIKTSTTTLQRRVGSVKNAAADVAKESGNRALRPWNATAIRQISGNPDLTPPPRVRALVSVKGQGRLLIYSSVRPVSVTARKMVRRKKVQETAAVAVAEVVSPLADGDKAGGVKVDGKRDGTVDMAGKEAANRKFVAKGDPVVMPFDYMEKTGELVVHLPAMSDGSADGGRWELTLSWPLSQSRPKAPELVNVKP